MKKLSNWREEHRDEYGDLIGGPKISKKQLKKNLSSNEKDEKITRSESLKFKVTGTKKELGRSSINSMDAETRKDYLKKQSELVRDKLLAQDKKKLSEEKKCGKGQYFCNDSQKCKPIPEGYHVMPDGMLMKGKKHSVNEVAPPTAKHERMVKHIKKSYKKDGKLSDDEKSIAYATAWKNYNKEEVVNEIAMKKDKKIPLGRKSNPYGKRAIAKMIIKSLAEPARSKAGVTKEDYIDELSKSTLASYIEKGARDIAGKANDASIKGMSGKRKEADKGYEKTARRVRGVSKAGYKLALKEMTSYKDFIKSAQEARDRVKKKQEDKKKKDAQYSDMKKRGIKFYDKKGSGRMVGGKKKYD